MTHVADVIALQTHDDSKVLRLERVEKLDSSAYACDLVVMSDGFGCQRRFFFGREELRSALAALQKMQNGRRAEAVLKEHYEQDYVRIALADDLGHVTVSGELFEYMPVQHLKFSFITDQTVLPQLSADLAEIENA